MTRVPRTASPQPRLHEIDFVRGGALFGILVVNLPFLGMPTEVATGVPALADRSGLFAWGVVRALFEFKFVSLFSLLFGASLYLQRETFRARGDGWVPRLLRRHAFLGVVGLVHGIVLFQGDILFPFALLGTVALVAFALPNRTVVFIAAGLLVLGVCLSVRGALVEGLGREPTAAAPFQEPIESIHDLRPSETRSVAAVELRVFREGPIWAAVVVRGFEYGVWLFVSTLYLGFNARVLALMLLGIVLMRTGVLEGRWSVARRRICLAGWIVGLPVSVVTTVLLALEPERSPGVWAAITAVHDVASLALAAAFATTLVAWAQSPYTAGLRAGVADAGRIAFTNYLGQSVLACLLFTGVGLAWYGERSRMSLLGISVVVFALQVVASRWWLSRYAMGPLEWVWRCVTHGKRVAMRVTSDSRHSP